MTLRSIASLVIAIFLGLIALVLVRGYLNKTGPRASAPAAQQVAAVVVATQPIPRGATLAPVMLRTVNYPADAVPTGSYHTVSELTGAGAAGHLALRDIAVNQPIMADNISGGGKGGLSITLTPGMRAVSLRTNDVAGVAGFALPGDRVDVLLTRNEGDGHPAVTQIVAQNVRVLGVDQTDDTNKPTVSKALTVEVTPDQAETIQLAQSVGSVTLTLRHVSDSVVLKHLATTAKDLGFNAGPGPAPAAGRPAVRTPPKLPPGLVTVTVGRGTVITGYAVSAN